MTASAGRRAAITCAIVLAAACGGAADPSPPAKPVYTARPLRDLTVPRTPERVARGQYLSEGLLQCFICHSERDWTQPGAPPIAAKKGAGTKWPDKLWLVPPNLTPDNETGIGRWTDDMLLRAMREGISHDGRTLHRQMWYASFRALPDDDAEAIVAYLRSLKPIRNPLPATVFPADQKVPDVPEPILTRITAAPESDAIQRGRRLADLADCSGCHTSWYTPTNPGLFGGGNLIERGDLKVWSSNLTSDPSGIPHYDEAFFREVLRTGRAKGRELSPLMPWTVFRNLNDGDLNDLFAYLRAVRPIKHVIDNIAASTTCAICGGQHPLGEYNHPRAVTLVDYPLSLVKDAVGTYRSESGWEVTTVIEQNTFKLRFGDGSTCALVTEDRKTFFCEGDIDYLEFVRDSAGAVTSVVNNGTDRGIRIR